MTDAVKTHDQERTVRVGVTKPSLSLTDVWRDMTDNNGVWVGVVDACGGDGIEIYASRSKQVVLMKIMNYLLAYWPDELPSPLFQASDGSARLPEDADLLMSLLDAWQEWQREMSLLGWAMVCFEGLEE